MAKVGICDWGIGGLGVYKLLREKSFSNADIIYFSDAGFMPYGKVSKEKLLQRWKEVKSFFKAHEVDLIIVACNALSTVVESDDHVITIASAVKRLVEKNKDQSLGIIGGVRTIESGIYDLGYGGHIGRVAQPLSALVERGVVEGEELENNIRNIIEPIQYVNRIILGCTHYPVLIPVMQKLYPEIDFIDPASELLKEIKLSGSGKGTSAFFSSGSLNEMRIVSKKVWNLKINEINSFE